MEAITDPGLLLKITPPKLRKTLLVRERLRRLGAADDDTAVILVEAPAGYGKTSLIAQWRLDWLQHGAAVAWLNLDAGDSPITLVSGIALGLRRSLGRGEFGSDAIDAVRRGPGTASALTSLLAEITEASRPMVIVFDNGERLGDAEAVEVLDYLLHNLPPNLRIVIGTRPPARTDTLDLLGQGMLRQVTVADLCFDPAEAIQLLTSRFGNRIDADLGARLQEITGGWPLGLQLAAAALERSTDPWRSIEEFSKSRDDATQHLFESLLASLPSELGDFLTRCSLLESLHPSLCEAVTGDDDAAYLLQRLLVETPLLSATEDGQWLRLHPLAREYLRLRATSTLTEEERRQIHVQAWHWLAGNGYPEPAAQHALLAGFESEAMRLVSACLYDELLQGHHGKVIEWLARIPPEVIGRNDRVAMVVLWANALTYRLEEVRQQATALIESPTTDEALRRESRLALATALAFFDRIDESRDYASLCGGAEANSLAQQALTNLRGSYLCYEGEPEGARRLLASKVEDHVAPLAQVFRDYFTCCAYLWEGRAVLAEQVARLQHARWAVQLGRRGHWTAMLGGVLAAACWQQDLRDDARALLAHRIDVTEQVTALDGLVYAYLTLVRMAVSEGDEARAFAHLEALARIGQSRGIPRLVVKSLVEQVRLHAARQRPVQAATVLKELAAVVEESAFSELTIPSVRLDFEVAQTLVASVADDAAGAHAHLALAKELATGLKRGYEAVEILALESLLAERAGKSPDALLTEALSRAESGGLVRVFADTLPELVELVRRRTQERPPGIVSLRFVGRVLAAAEATVPSERPPTPSGGSALLTPKEDEVLQLLAGGLPNKRIAAELGVSSETVKWHVKKVLAKLNAGGRDHAVERARMLGLVR